MPLNVPLIKHLRIQLNMTQDEAAKRAKLKTKQAWNNIESGRQTNLTISILEKVAKALGVSAKDLLK